MYINPFLVGKEKEKFRNSFVEIETEDRFLNIYFDDAGLLVIEDNDSKDFVNYSQLFSIFNQYKYYFKGTDYKEKILEKLLEFDLGSGVAVLEMVFGWMIVSHDEEGWGYLGKRKDPSNSVEPIPFTEYKKKFDVIPFSQWPDEMKASLDCMRK
jgi:hypothetical protein